MGSAKFVLALAILIIASGAGILYFISKEDLTYYHNLNEVLGSPNQFIDKNIRLLGLVEEGSLNWDPTNLKLDFTITEDKSQNLQVSFEGVKPDLFKANQGVVAGGRLSKAGSHYVFKADELLVKHSPEYRVEDHQQAKQKYNDYIKSLE